MVGGLKKKGPIPTNLPMHNVYIVQYDIPVSKKAL